MTGGTDYYDLLGVERKATEEEIRRAFRKLAMEWHPDRNKDQGAEERFKLVNEAYQTLIDPKKRQLYDRYGREGLGAVDGSPGRGFDGVGFPGGLGDIFDAFFGGFDVRRETGPRRGADLHNTLNISFEEALFGVEKELEVQRMELCPVCVGARTAPGTHMTRCANCRGTGQVRRAQSGFFGQFVQVVTCGVCRGEGKMVETPCSECKGMGRARHSRQVTVQVPPGIDDGMQLRLSGEGEAGWSGSPPGSLYITMTVREHPLYSRRGQNLVLELPVNVAQAALGATVDIPLLGDGTERIKIPSGVQAGTVLRVKNRGVPSLENGKQGDLLVVVQVVTPRRLDARSKKLFQELERVLEPDPVE